jgi:hypothetical protein
VWSALRNAALAFTAGSASALLPSPERERLARKVGVDPPRWSLALGSLELGAGTASFMVGGIRYVTGQATVLSLGLLERWRPGLSTADLQATGLVAWFGWLLHPAAWLWAGIALVGLVRVLAFAAAREAVAEPWVWGLLRVAQAWDARRFRRRHAARFGPDRPDRVLQADDGRRLTVIASREKPDWRDGVIIEVAERFYRLADVEERAAGGWTRIVYTLREIEAGGLIRRLVRYRPPAGGGTGAAGTE